jgi:hypothetical protein
MVLCKVLNDFDGVIVAGVNALMRIDFDKIPN